MNSQDIRQRFVALNFIGLILSFKSLPYPTYFSSFFYNEHLLMPDNYVQYFQSSICLPGVLVNDPIITQMLEVRRSVQQRLDSRQIFAEAKFILQCSQNCLWMFYFVDCGKPNDSIECPICRKPIGAATYNTLIKRDPPQIQRTIEDAFAFIDNHIKHFHENVRFAFENNLSSAVHSSSTDKSQHLNQPISFRLMHFFTHTLLLFLDELSLINEFQRPTDSFFREHFERDYSLIGEQLGDSDQCSLWLYKLFGHILNKNVDYRGTLNNNKNVIEFEKLLEEKLFFNHLESVGNEIIQYKSAYVNFIREQINDNRLEDFVDEIIENETKYPHLLYFNVTNIYTTNPMDEFRLRLDMIPYVEKKYPATVLLVKRLSTYANIQHLHPIIVFTNYLIEKFNLRIKRNDASEKTIDYYFTHGTDCERFKQVYETFLTSWYSLELSQVQYGCQVAQFQLKYAKDEFASRVKLAMLLLNTSKDESSILLAACLKTLAESQNEIVHFFHKNIVHDQADRLDQHNSIPIQSIQFEHTLCIDGNYLSKKLINDGLTINYQYGRSKHIIYDFEEIEITLRNLISSLPLIDTEHMRFLNYQFELYTENTSLINDVRQRVQQKTLKQNERDKLTNLLSTMQNDDLLHYLGSLDYVFTYLRNFETDQNNGSLTIQNFVERSIKSRACLNDHVLQRPPFATIELQFIIDLYELIEECAFDQVLRHYVKPNLSEESLSLEQRTELINQFRQSTFNSDRIGSSLKQIDPWIGILKRLMVRVLSNVHVSLDVPIQLYLERTDLWPGTIPVDDLRTIEVTENILLQHTYILLKGLEKERDQIGHSSQNSNSLSSLDLQNQDTQFSEARTWHNNSISLTPRVLKVGKTGKKVRV